MNTEEKPIRDCPVFDLTPIRGKHDKVNIEGTPGILAYPGTVIQARVENPYPNGICVVHIRSRFARAGANAFLLSNELERNRTHSGRAPKIVSILIVHQNTWPYPILFRENDVVVAIADYLEITRRRSTIPHAEICPEAVSNGTYMFLCIGNQRLEIIEKNLPLFPFSRIHKVPYIDPFAEDRSSYMKPTVFKQFSIPAGKSFIVSTKERIRIPPGHNALLHPIAPEFIHSSALIINPGTEGYQALEFQARRNTIVCSDTTVMMLSVYECPTLDEYNGRYKIQHAIGF